MSNELRAHSRWFDAARLLLASVFLAGAAYNGLVTLRAPSDELRGLIALSPVPAYRRLAARVSMPHPTLFVVSVIIFEVSVALSTLLSPELRRPGYIAALLFFFVLAPLISWYGLTNLIWAVPAFILLRYDRR